MNRHQKLVMAQSKVEPFHLSQDIGETCNLASQMPEKVAELQTQFLRWQQELKAKPGAKR